MLKFSTHQEEQFFSNLSPQQQQQYLQIQHQQQTQQQVEQQQQQLKLLQQQQQQLTQPQITIKPFTGVTPQQPVQQQTSSQQPTLPLSPQHIFTQSLPHLGAGTGTTITEYQDGNTTTKIQSGPGFQMITTSSQTSPRQPHQHQQHHQSFQSQTLPSGFHNSQPQQIFQMLDFPFNNSPNLQVNNGQLLNGVDHHPSQYGQNTQNVLPTDASISFQNQVADQNGQNVEIARTTSAAHPAPSSDTTVPSHTSHTSNMISFPGQYRQNLPQNIHHNRILARYSSRHNPFVKHTLYQLCFQDRETKQQQSLLSQQQSQNEANLLPFHHFSTVYPHELYYPSAEDFVAIHQSTQYKLEIALKDEVYSKKYPESEASASNQKNTQQNRYFHTPPDSTLSSPDFISNLSSHLQSNSEALQFDTQLLFPIIRKQVDLSQFFNPVLSLFGFSGSSVNDSTQSSSFVNPNQNDDGLQGLLALFAPSSYQDNTSLYTEQDAAVDAEYNLKMHSLDDLIEHRSPKSTPKRHNNRHMNPIAQIFGILDDRIDGTDDIFDDRHKHFESLHSNNSYEIDKLLMNDPFIALLGGPLQHHAQTLSQDNQRHYHPQFDHLDAFFGGVNQRPRINGSFDDSRHQFQNQDPFARMMMVDPIEMGFTHNGGMSPFGSIFGFDSGLADPFERAFLRGSDGFGSRDRIGDSNDSRTALQKSFSSSAGDNFLDSTQNDVQQPRSSPQRRSSSWSSSTVTRIGPDGVAQTEHEEEEVFDDGTPQGKKHKKIVEKKIRAAHRPDYAKDNSQKTTTVEPLDECFRVESDLTTGNTKIIHKRQLGDKSRERVEEINAYEGNHIADELSCELQTLAPPNNASVTDNLHNINEQDLGDFDTKFDQFRSQFDLHEDHKQQK